MTKYYYDESTVEVNGKTFNTIITDDPVIPEVEVWCEECQEWLEHDRHAHFTMRIIG